MFAPTLPRGRSTSPLLGVTVSKRRAIAIALLCAMGGLAVGAVVGFRFAASLLNDSVASSAATKVVFEDTVLRRLHDGGADEAGRYLQNDLDTELIVVAVGVKAGYKLAPEERAAIANIKRLRELTGYSPDPAIRKMVDNALALGQ